MDTKDKYNEDSAYCQLHGHTGYLPGCELCKLATQQVGYNLWGVMSDSEFVAALRLSADDEGPDSTWFLSSPDGDSLGSVPQSRAATPESALGTLGGF